MAIIKQHFHTFFEVSKNILHITILFDGFNGFRNGYENFKTLFDKIGHQTAGILVLKNVNYGFFAILRTYVLTSYS